ncbi:hypothetical protein NMG60_11012533 [Bertholletia excelsa]
MQQESSAKPNEATVVSTLSACTALKFLKLGREIHHYVGSGLGYTIIISNALLDMYCKCGCLSTAREIFDAIPTKSVISWTTMVSGYVNCGQLDEARVLFDRSPVRDIVLWTAMINGYVQFNRVDEAVAMFREMQIQRVKPDKFTLVTLLTGCAQLGALEQEKDTASWTSIICGLALNGMTCEALDMFSEMKQAGFKPDDITFIGVLNACSHGGHVEEGRRHFSSMKIMYQIEPKLEHYGCLIDLLGRSGLLVEAENLIEKIPKGSNEIIVPLCGSLLSACRTHGNVDIGERVARRLVEIGYNESSIHTLLANIYASANRWEDVTKVRKKMKALGVKKNPGCSSIEVDGHVHEFLVGDASHPEMKEVYSMLDSIIKPLSGIEEMKMDRDITVTDELR